jgi:hypothetical protein
MELIAQRLIPGGSAAIQQRILSMIGEYGFHKTHFDSISRFALLDMTKLVYENVVKERYPKIIERSKETNPSSNGINIYYPIKVTLDTRWPHRYGWNSIHRYP